MRRVVIAVLVLRVFSASVHADPVNCQKQIIKNMLKYKKTYLKKAGKCIDNENLGKIPGPCPDAATQLKIQTTATKVHDAIVAACPDPDLTTLGFPTNCAFDTTATGVEGGCAALPVTNAGEFASCVLCWKGAELAEFLGILYASHAEEICGGELDDTSTVCSDFDCSTPLPVQRNLGDTAENDCQKAIGKAGIKHLVSIEKVYEKCGLLGSTRGTCLADPIVQQGIQKSQLKLQTLITNKCGANRDPIPDPPFCCRTAPQMQTCTTAATSRQDCTDNIMGTVVEGKTCNGTTNQCENSPGSNQHITWWSTCPINPTCDGTLDTLDELITCVDDSAEEAASELLCIQFASGWCPPTGSASAAFVD